MSAPIAIHSRVSMPRSSLRYPRILFITALPFRSPLPEVRRVCSLLRFCRRRSVLGWSPPLSLLHLFRGPYLVRPHVREAAALQSQNPRGHLIRRKPEPDGARRRPFMPVLPSV